ncbi:hypothetical protein [Sphingomonas xinjiangensis]|uniref:Uncharacterized protein n=1 Tax=Sphingomonas xinjiangensis TaxID=643568 RepID=A0A840YTN3_9SPHN|nr:hypothetical protein [Sphingomonas xinjiangensis]MBB5713081.1 hypothetical protein [Sphingomonas xinjiangensis]
MIWPAKVLAVLSLAACTMQDENHRHEALMDSIERSVVLPKGSQPLSAYGRSYAFAGQDRVIGSYSIPVNSPTGPCTVVIPGNSSRACSAEEDEPIEQTAAGTRRWFDDADDVPKLLWAGCDQVNVVYEISSQRVLETLCEANR